MDAIMTRLIAGLLLLCCTGNLQAQQLADPTRPATAPPAAPGIATAQGGATALGQLQSVLIGRSGRRVAVISGETLRVGDKFRGAMLVGITENAVQLKKGSKMHVLTLFPTPLARRPNAISGAEQ